MAEQVESMNPDDRLLGVADLVRMTGLGERTIRRWLTTGGFPAADYRLGGRHLRWRRDTINTWLAEQTVPVRPAISPTARLAKLSRSSTNGNSQNERLDS